MLPFLKPRKQDGLIISTRKPDGEGIEMESSDEQIEQDQALKACALDLIRGLSDKDQDKVANALKAAFQILEAMPDEDESSEDEKSE